MNLPAIVLAGVAVIVGLLIGYVLAAARVRAAAEAKWHQAESARAALDATVVELRGQLDSQRTSLSELQARLETEKEQRAAAQTAFDKSQEYLAEQRKTIEETKADMKAVFQALASEALTESTSQFLELARARFESIQQEASTELETRKVAIDALVRPLAEALGKLQVQVTQVSQAGTDLAARVLELRQETGTLSTALRQPRTRGSWGELTLRRAVELAGMSAHCDFVEQQTLTGEGGRLRPDMIVHLPGGRDIAVDAKVPLNAFLDAAEATSERDRQQAMARHVQLVRAHMRQLASKAYWSEIPSAPEFVVLFMPGESFFSAALEGDPQLLEQALAGQERVLPASPITLIALLMAVEHGWRQKQMEENAARISSLGRDLYERLATFVEHIAGIREGLDKAGTAYNRAVGSFNGRLLPSARRLRELGVSPDAELPALEPTDVELRPPPETDDEPHPA
jgi:DNA recombination protein RmuC